mgnify:CR=1 FL=1
MTATISVILNLIQNQLDPDFRQDDSYGMILSARRIKMITQSASWRIALCVLTLVSYVLRIIQFATNAI